MTKRTNIILGTVLIIVPFVLLYYGYISYTTIKTTMKGPVSIEKGFGITITNPPKDFFSPLAQIIAAVGTGLSSVCWGVAKIIKELRK